MKYNRERVQLVLPLVSSLLLSWLVVATHAQDALEPVFMQDSISQSWREDSSELSDNLESLNAQYNQTKSTESSPIFTYSISQPNPTPFELYDLDGQYLNSQDRRDYSHELELRLQPTSQAGTVLDYEQLPATKSYTLQIEATPKSREELVRLFGEDQIDDLIAQQQSLDTTQKLTIEIAIENVDESPIVQPAYHPSANHNQGRIIQLNSKDRGFSVSINAIFTDPEGKPLFTKPNLEDIEIREYQGRAPHFGNIVNTVGDTELETNGVEGNSPSEDGHVVTITQVGGSYVINPVKSTVEGIRKAEILIRGWDQRGPTVPLLSADPATTKDLAKITVLVQTGDNKLPLFRGGASGFLISADEGFISSLAPRIGSWAAQDPDGDEVTHTLKGQAKDGACKNAIIAGVTFQDTCFRLEPDGSSLAVNGTFDYESFEGNPVIPLTIVATDTFGATTEATLDVRIKDLDEPVTSEFNPSTVDLHLTHRATHSIDLNSVFKDPEGKETFTFRTTSRDELTVKVAIEDSHLLELSALKLGSVYINVWADTKDGERTYATSLQVIVRDTNEPPTFTTEETSLTYAVSEAAEIGTVIGELISASDPDTNDQLTFKLSPNRFFALTQKDLKPNQVQLALKAPVDFERAPTHTLQLTVSDGIESAQIPIKINVSDIDEPPRTSRRDNPPIKIGENQSLTIDANDYFEDDSPTDLLIDVYGIDTTILDAEISQNQLLTLSAKSVGSTTVNLLARDSLGQAAIASQEVQVIATEAPQLVKQIPDQTIELGLDEISLLGYFEDADSDFSISQATSQDEEILWVFLTKNDPFNLVTYAWDTGTTKVSVTAEDPQGNTSTATFSVTVVESAVARSELVDLIEIPQGDEQILALDQLFKPSLPNILEVQPLSTNQLIADIDIDTPGNTLKIKGVAPGQTGIVLIASGKNQTKRAAKLRVKVTSNAPTINADIANVTIELGGEHQEIDLSEVFSHPRPLRFETEISDKSIIDAHIQNSTVVLRALARGQSNLVVKAIEPSGQLAQVSTQVTVSDEGIHTAEQESLSLLGNTLLSSVSTVLSDRVTQPLRERKNRDLTNSYTPTAYSNQTRISDSYRYSNTTGPTWGASTEHLNVSSPSLTYHPHSTNSTSQLWNLDLQHNGDKRSWSLWSAADSQSFNTTKTQGHVDAHYIGSEVVLSDQWLLGISGSQLKGNTQLGFGSIKGELNLNQTMWIPYLQYQPSERSLFWLVAAQGNGAITSVRDHVVDRNSERLRSQMALMGASQRLWDKQKFSLAMQADLGRVSMDVQGIQDTDSQPVNVARHMKATAQQLSAGLDLSYRHSYGKWTVTPSMELNLRSDETQAFKGSGVETITGLQISKGVFNLDLQGRHFNVSGLNTYQESGASLAVTLQPNQDGSGLSFTIQPIWGMPHTTIGGLDGLRTSQSSLNHRSSQSMQISELSMSWNLAHGWLIQSDRWLLVPYISQSTGSFLQKEMGLRLHSIVMLDRGLQLDLSAQESDMNVHDGFSRGFRVTGSLSF